ncbi:MAG: hypothetical protein WCI77_02910, partial [Candidatus Omnitrophota bacterium]
TSTRQNAGASYYGAMELSENLWERPVSIGNATARSFGASNGDGTLSSTGNSTTADWPGAEGNGFRGGSWSSNSSEGRVSDRSSGSAGYSDRRSDSGVRLARTP